MNRLFNTSATNQHFAEMLKLAMRDCHVNGTQLSRLSGISRSMVNKLRNGEHSPTLDMIVNLNAGLAKVDGHPILQVLRDSVPVAVAIQPEPEPVKPEPVAVKPEPVKPVMSMLDQIKANLNK